MATFYPSLEGCAQQPCLSWGKAQSAPPKTLWEQVSALLGGLCFPTQPIA